MVCRIADGKFSDFRWIDGRWDFSQFADGQGNTDWDAVSCSLSSLNDFCAYKSCSLKTFFC